MREALFLCFILALVGTSLRILIDSAGARAAAKAVAALCGALMLLALFGAVHGGTQSLPHIDITDESDRFESISAATLDSVCREAESLLAARLCDGITDAVGKAPSACSVRIAREDLRVLSVEVVFRSGELYSSYEVKEYVRAQCGTDVSVEVVTE